MVPAHPAAQEVILLEDSADEPAIDRSDQPEETAPMTLEQRGKAQEDWAAFLNANAARAPRRGSVTSTGALVHVRQLETHLSAGLTEVQALRAKMEGPLLELEKQLDWASGTVTSELLPFERFLVWLRSFSWALVLTCSFLYSCCSRHGHR